MEPPWEYLLLGPAHPFRGGIANTQHQLANALIAQQKSVQLLTFTQLYPHFLFPGKSQWSSESAPKNLDIVRLLHTYNPLTWKKAIAYINQKKPKKVIFRYYTPFLAPLYRFIAQGLHPDIKKIALVDNWIPHERKPWDSLLNRYFGKQMDGFTTLSPYVAAQIEAAGYKNKVWAGFHPIAEGLPVPISKAAAREILGWKHEPPTVLFFGLIRPYKGLDLLIRAFAEAPLKNSPIQLRIVGECYENPKKYTDLVDALELNNKIHFHFTYAEKEAIRDYFCASDVVAQTYRTATQSGVPPLAYHFERPLLVSDTPGLRDPILQDQSGIVVENTPQQIAQKLQTLLATETVSLYKENISRAKSNYHWKDFVQQWEAALESQF